jgi:hypothetical protein
MSNEIERRGFLKLSGMGGVILASGLGGLVTACGGSSGDVTEAPPAPSPAPSSAKSVTAFSFLRADNAIPVDSTATIDGTAIQAFLPPGTDRTALKAAFGVSAGATLAIGAAAQTTQATPNDFTQPVSYVVTAEDGSVANYTVTLVTDLAAFDDTVNAFMSKYTVPAVSIAVTHDDKLIYLKSYGQPDREAGLAARPGQRVLDVVRPVGRLSDLRSLLSDADARGPPGMAPVPARCTDTEQTVHGVPSA